MQQPDPTTVPDRCSNANNCIRAEHHADGSVTLWSDRRPDQRTTLDPDEVPGWLRPVDGDLRAVAAQVVAAHMLGRDLGIKVGPGNPWAQPNGKSFALADAVLVAVLPAHREQVLDEAAEAIELAEGRRCPECRGKPASLKWNRSYEREGRCGRGHRWTIRRRDWTDPVEVIRRLAATGPETTPIQPVEPDRAEVVPEEAPEAQRPIEGVYRVGRKLGRTIYRRTPHRTGAELDYQDELIGIMDHPEYAALVVDVLNSVVEEETRFWAAHAPARADEWVLDIEAVADDVRRQMAVMAERAAKLGLDNVAARNAALAQVELHRAALAEVKAELGRITQQRNAAWVRGDADGEAIMWLAAIIQRYRPVIDAAKAWYAACDPGAITAPDVREPAIALGRAVAALDDDGEQKTAHAGASEDIRTEETP
jgi:hypothetical protein